jgi:hypothetical protein
MTDETADFSRTFTFRLPVRLVEAMQSAAHREMLSMSDLARLAIAKDLRQRGMFGDSRAA